MGYQYLVMPVLVTVVAILLMAVAFNAFFPWRRYPAHFIRRRRPLVITQPAVRQFELTHEDFSAAMEELNSYVDITTENLTDLIELAKQHAERTSRIQRSSLPAATTATASWKALEREAGDGSS